MKILLICSGYLPSTTRGVELHVHQLAKELKKQGNQVLVLCRDYAPGKPDYNLEWTEYDSVPMVKLNRKFSDCDTLEKLYADPTVSRIFRDLVAEFQPHIAHIHHIYALSTEIATILKEKGVPTVMTLHDFWMGCPRGQRLTASLNPCPAIDLKKCMPCLRELWPGFFKGGQDRTPRTEADGEDMALLENYHAKIHHVLESVDRLVAPSQFMKNVLVRYGISPSRITVVRHGLDHALFSKMTHVRSTTTRFGYTGSILPSKGVHILIEAFKRIGGSNVRLNIWGEVLPFHKDTNYGHRLAVLTKGWESSIQFRGAYVNEDLPTILSKVDVLVVPSIWYEAFCRPLWEGFLAGVPVIASNFGAMAEAIEDRETGLLFKVGDSVDLAEKMRLLMSDRPLGERLAGSPKDVPTLEENAAAVKKIYREISGLSID